MAVEQLLLAVDIGATNTLISVRSPSEIARGWTVGERILKSPTIADPERLVAWIAAEAGDLAPAAGRIAAAGIAAPGPLDVASGVVARSPNLGWTDVPLAAMLRRHLAAPVALDDDAKAAALGEWRFGAGRGTGTFAYLTLSSGVGSAIVIDGRVLRGFSGNAGEIGHLVIDPSGPRCGCGNRGDVESFLGGSSLARQARRAWPSAVLPDGTAAPRDAREVFRAARKGDAAATTIVDAAVEALACALAAMAATVEPERIAVGGALGLAQRGLVRRGRARAARRVLRESGRALSVVPAELADESVLAGAMTLAERALG